ncbi:hypothetical protein DBV15_03255 [Temnothorax longispinosus]|uniref:Uncharacterized protein n=1 Tax=Temnothorax longispinosus TaxID=300112 RepID=A0A4S2JM51_9HYME|nr:hypothetical protein DBV15_03255 [Temnothorax longispinosus]
MLRSSIWVGLLILYGTILAEDMVPYDGLHHYISHATDQTSRTGRFGFSALNEIRQSFCRSFCTSADTMPYLLNLLCAAKCPELYLPHHTTTTPMSTSVTMPTAVNMSTTVKNPVIHSEQNQNPSPSPSAPTPNPSPSTSTPAPTNPTSPSTSTPAPTNPTSPSTSTPAPTNPTSPTG